MAFNVQEYAVLYLYKSVFFMLMNWSFSFCNDNCSVNVVFLLLYDQSNL